MWMDGSAIPETHELYEYVQLEQTDKEMCATLKVMGKMTAICSRLRNNHQTYITICRITSCGIEFTGLVVACLLQYLIGIS